jgi:hypothetical protein
MSQDVMEIMYRFGTEITNALNQNKVVPPEGKYLGAILVVVGDDTNLKEPPVGGSLNWDKDARKWFWTEQLERAERGAEVVAVVRRGEQA